MTKNETHKPRRELDPEETRHNISGKAWVRSLPDTNESFVIFKEPEGSDQKHKEDLCEFMRAATGR